MPRMTTRYMDQISEHQRDLTNSASSRFIPEIMLAIVLSADRLNKIMKKMTVDKTNMQNNFNKSKGMVIAEPLYILLASHGHPNAHEHVRKLTLEAQKTGKSLSEIATSDETLRPYLEKFTPRQREIIENPEKYTGIAAIKTVNVCDHWKNELSL
jgi:adenylosuccinate lyase